MAISLQQPMRPAEIELVGAVNDNTEGLASEIATRTEQYTQLHTDIENTNTTVAELGNSLNTLNTTVGELGDNLTSVTNRVTTIEGKFPVDTENIADGAITQDKLATYAVGSNEIQDKAVLTANLADNAVTSTKIADGTITNAKLDSTLAALIASFPTLTYGESAATTVQANSNVLVDITFPNTLTEAPNVYCMARSTVCVECNVEQVTNSQVSIRLYNNTNSDAESVSIDWLAISGR